MEGEEGNWCEDEWVKKYFFCRVVENVPKIASGYFGAELKISPIVTKKFVEKNFLFFSKTP